MGVAERLGFVPWEDPVLGGGPKQAEKGGAEEDAGDHFGNDLGLTEAGGEGTDEAAKEEDDGQLEEELDGELEVVHGRF